MTGQPASGPTQELTFRRVTGEQVRAAATVDYAESRVGDFLTARKIWLDDGTELRQLSVAPKPDRGSSYDRLDNEILAGRRLYLAAVGVSYPPVLSRLYGDEADSADPYVLLDPYRGEPLEDVVGYMMLDEQRAFEVSLLTALCWLEIAGIAHRGLSPRTVRWDSDTGQAQITDFGLGTVFGVPREVIGPRAWVGPEQRPGDKVGGLVTEHDDMHAAGRLIYYVRSQGENIDSVSQLAAPGFADLRPLFGPPPGRPAARELLASRPGAGDRVPRGISGELQLKDGRERFDFVRRGKHPGITGPADQRSFWNGADAGRTGGGDKIAGASGETTWPQVPLKSAQADPVMAEAAAPREAAHRGKRSWWKWGDRS